jgi:DNA-binding HxlR family transcriptional regulator
MSADERGEEFLRVLCLKDTIHILRHLRKHDEVQFTQFAEFVNPVTLQRRLKQLLRLNIIEHHLEREDVRKEWYEFTEKGRKVLQILEDIIKVAEDEESISLEDVYKNIENSGGAPG